MNPEELARQLAQAVSGFAEHWSAEDICREDDGSYSPHGLMTSFREFMYFEKREFSLEEARKLSPVFESVLESNIEDMEILKMAIHDCFLSVADVTKIGKTLEPELGPLARKIWGNP